jgi:hypothetical protein
LGLVLPGNVQAQSLSLRDECDLLATTASQNAAFLSTFETELDQFSRTASQAESLEEITTAARQYDAVVGGLINGINGLSIALGNLSLADFVLDGYRDDYILVAAGFVDSLNLAREAMAVIAATEDASDLRANVATSEAQFEIASAQIEDLISQESAIIDAFNQYCGFTTTVVPPNPVVPFPDESPTIAPPASTGTPSNNGGGGSTPATPPRIEGYDYTEAMLMGYTAAEARDWHTALINFRRALAARPGDRYALAAIANMEAYIADQRLLAARRQRAIDLQATLAEAVAIGDWACAAASVDELVTLVPPNSLDRAQLVTYRGEITGFIEARDRVENWSTVCPG